MAIDDPAAVVTADPATVAAGIGVSCALVEDDGMEVGGATADGLSTDVQDGRVAAAAVAPSIAPPATAPLVVLTGG